MVSAAGAVLLCLLFSAVVSATHTATTLIGQSRLRTLRDEGFSGAESLIAVRAQADVVRWSVRLVTRALNLSALGIGVASGVFTWGRFGPWADVVVGLFTVILLADVLPHALAARSAVRLALSGSPRLLTLTRFTRLVSAPISHLGGAIAGETDEETSAERELRQIQELGQEAGHLEESENLLVERAFRLDELTAWDVMIPRVDIFAWKQDLRLKDVRDELNDVPHSRIPVYDGSVDEVTGIVFVREAYERIARGQDELKLSEISRDPVFVPGSLSCAQLLRDFQAMRVHMVIVADEFGGTDGLVTLEDVLEELVGEIHDETDVAELEIIRLSDEELDCDASVDVREINEALSVDLPKDEHRSLNGLILEELGHVPPQGEKLITGGVQIEITESTETQVLRAHVTRLPDVPDT